MEHVCGLSSSWLASCILPLPTPQASSGPSSYTCLLCLHSCSGTHIPLNWVLCLKYKKTLSQPHELQVPTSGKTHRDSNRDIQGHRKCLENPAVSQPPGFILVSGPLEMRHKGQGEVSSEVQMSVKTEGREEGSDKCSTYSL